MTAIPAFASRPRQRAGLAGIQGWFWKACQRLRECGTTYDLDPHLAADTGLANVKLPFLPRRPTTFWRISTWME